MSFDNFCLAFSSPFASPLLTSGLFPSLTTHGFQRQKLARDGWGYPNEALESDLEAPAPTLYPPPACGKGVPPASVELEVSGLAVILALLFLAQVCVWGGGKCMRGELTPPAKAQAP